MADLDMPMRGKRIETAFPLSMSEVTIFLDALESRVDELASDPTPAAQMLQESIRGLQVRLQEARGRLRKKIRDNSKDS